MTRSAPTRALRRAARLVLSPAARADALHEWRRRRGPEPALPAGEIRRVLVVCHGNICRSPVAAALLAERLPALDVRSGGLHTRDGRPAEPAAHRVAGTLGVDLSAHRSHALVAEDVARSDLVLVMEGHQAAELERRWPEGVVKTRLLGHFLEAPPFALEDPWGRDDEVFHSVFARIDRAVTRLVARLDARLREARP